MFYVWYRRALPTNPILKDPYDPRNPLTPKTLEIVQDETKLVDGEPKHKVFFEKSMATAFSEARRILVDEVLAA